MSRIALRLAWYERRRLRAQLKRTHDAGLYRRTLALLAVDQGQPIQDLAELLQVSRQSIYHWIDTYQQAQEPMALADHRGQGRPRLCTEDVLAVVESALKQSPQVYGYPAANWTVPLLEDHLACCTGVEMSEDTLRRQLHGCGYVWKRFRYELPVDPELEKKTANPPPDPAFVPSERDPGRRRDRSAVAAAPACGLGLRGATGTGADQWGQCALYSVRRYQH